MPDEQRLSLEVERLRTESYWRTLSEYMAMSVAAAVTFHQVHGNTNAIITRADYDDALNIAASALSRLITVYTSGTREGRVPVTVDITRQRFGRGATQLQSPDGSIVDELSVRRSEMVSALSLIKRAGLPFSFAALPSESSTSEQSTLDRSTEGLPKKPA